MDAASWKSEQKKSNGNINTIPWELISMAFSFLSPENLGRACCVCRKWNELGSSKNLWDAFDLKKIFPMLKILDEAEWRTYVDLSSLEIQMEDNLPVNKRIVISKLRKILSSKAIDVKSGLTLLTMPNGLTFNKLRKIACSPKQGNPTCFKEVWNLYANQLGNEPIKKTYRVIITNSIFKESDKMSYQRHQELIEKNGCKIPEAMPMASLTVLTYISSEEKPPTCLYKEAVLTRSSNDISQYPFVVGSYFSTETSPAPGLFVVDNYADHFGAGVSGLWEIP